MSCQFPGCSKPAFQGSSYCSKSHRDASKGSGQTQGAGVPSQVAPPGGSIPTQGLCQFPGCTKPAFSGSTYCSRSHRDNAAAQAPNPASNPAPVHSGGAPSGNTTCQFTGCTKPVFPGSAYCSRSHRDAAAQSSGTPATSSGMPTNPPMPGGGGPPSATSPSTCAFPGCSKPVFAGSMYCSRSHRDAAPAQGGGNPSSGMPANPPTPQGGGALPSAACPSTCAFSGCSKPVFAGSMYCSKSHRDAASAQGGGNPSSGMPVNPPTQGGGALPSAASPSTCAFPGCSKPVFAGGKYCSKSHRDNAPTT